MANRHPNAVTQPIIIPAILQTGVVSTIAGTTCGIELDPDQTVWNGRPQDAFVLTWKDCRRPPDSAFLYRAKAWRGRDGRHMVRIQKHHIYNDRMGRRVVILLKVNGQIAYGA